MINDKYNYSLNGIEHEIILNDKIKIDQKPINEKILVSNKYMIKYINDLFDYHCIEYSFIGDSLLGIYIFNGINIFNPKIEICTLDTNFFKIKKLESEIKNDDFNIQFDEKYIKIYTTFFDNIKTTLYIYPLNNDSQNDLLKYITFENILVEHLFYDIFPLKKNKFEEFEVSIPNKIEKVLESFHFNLNYINFSFNKKKKNNKNIIEEVEVKPTLISNFISIIKPFIFQ